MNIYSHSCLGQSCVRAVPALAHFSAFGKSFLALILALWCSVGIAASPDTLRPRINCPVGPLEICDTTANDANLWNADDWWDMANLSQNLPETAAAISIAATDSCPTPNLTIHYLLFLDLDGDGTTETVVNSADLPGADTIMFGNEFVPDFVGGEARRFDFRNLPAKDRYRFAIQRVATGRNMTAAIKWNTVAAPNVWVDPQLPYGTHRVRWVVRNGCGNESTCEYPVVVKDCAKPSITCVKDRTINMSRLAYFDSDTIFVRDLLLAAADNTTPGDLLEYALGKKGIDMGFPTRKDEKGMDVPVTELHWGCPEFLYGLQFAELWVKDRAGNVNTCQTKIIATDSSSRCQNLDFSMIVTGRLTTPQTFGIEGATVSIREVSSSPDRTSFRTKTLESNGSGQFNHSQFGYFFYRTFSVTPVKNDDVLNGVTSFDLALISKHILGKEPLDSPYKLIAADANKSGSVTTIDIVLLRKLILGEATQLPDSTSWRFVDKRFAFPKPENPFATPFPEFQTFTGDSAKVADFVGVKIGDVNYTATSNGRGSDVESLRDVLFFETDDRMVRAGDVVNVTFRATAPTSAYQFTLRHPGLDALSITGQKAEYFSVFADRQMLTTAWNDNGSPAAFTVTFRATRSGRLSRMLSVSGEITAAIAYNGRETASVGLRFRGSRPIPVVNAAANFELYQNAPNPFSDRTIIGFTLPAAADATLTVFDAAGRQVYAQSGFFDKGYNQVALDRAQVGTAAGLLYYRLQTPEGQFMRSMTVVPR